MKHAFAYLSYFLTILFCTFRANAFPELIRHGYASCTACHVSTTGGGLTTPYGRSLSKEILSTWGKEGEERLLYSIEPPEWLNVGGDIRWVQTDVNTNSFRQKKSFIMQADLEAAFTHDKLFAVFTAGIRGGPSGTPKKYEFFSRRHYVGYRHADEWSFRAGRFMPAFGINVSNHTTYTRSELGFDEGTERDNLEAAYIGEKWESIITLIMGRLDENEIDHEKGIALTSSYFINDKHKVGGSLLSVHKNNSSRQLAAIHAILGFTKELYLLTEIDGQWTKSKSFNGPSTRGALTLLQLGYEWRQGIHTYIEHQISYLNFDDISSRRDSFGAGVKFYPRPHIDINAEFKQERTLSFEPNYYDVAWLMLHYYL